VQYADSLTAEQVVEVVSGLRREQAA
jgi:hypothetical protein